MLLWIQNFLNRLRLRSIPFRAHLNKSLLIGNITCVPYIALMLKAISREQTPFTILIIGPVHLRTTSKKTEMHRKQPRREQCLVIFKIFFDARCVDQLCALILLHRFGCLLESNPLSIINTPLGVVCQIFERLRSDRWFQWWTYSSRLKFKFQSSFTGGTLGRRMGNRQMGMERCGQWGKDVGSEGNMRAAKETCYWEKHVVSREGNICDILHI